MIRKLLCWLGWHEYWYDCKLIECAERKFHCESCQYSYQVCKYCEKLKKEKEFRLWGR